MNSNNLGGRRGLYVYTVCLLFSLVYSYTVYILQFFAENAAYVFIYLTNWTFTLFLISTGLLCAEFFFHFYLVSKKRVRIFIFHVSIITRPVYLYVCLVYLVSLGMTFIGFGDLLSPEHIEGIKRDFLFYFSDISKHFVFVGLVVVLFILAPRTDEEEFAYKWWKFLYPVAFVCVFLIFSILYYIATDGVKIYNISNLTIIILASITAPLLFTIYMCFKLGDDAIKRRLFDT